MDATNIPMKDVILLRENMKAETAFPGSNHLNGDAVWDFLSAYDQGGTLLKRSIGHAANVEIRMNYKGLEFISKPGHTSDLISVTFDSLLDFVNS